jgi:AbrB family looped-hinge helix DNA binding protein
MELAVPITLPYQAIVSSQGQITIPARIRKALGLEAGAVISLVAKKLQDGAMAIVAYALPADPAEKYYALGRKAYQKWGGATKVLTQERTSWGTR